MHQRSAGNTSSLGDASGFCHFSTSVLSQMTEKEAEAFIHAFVRRVQAYEDAPMTNDAAELEEAGITLPAPAGLDDAALTRKLWEVIDGLAEMRTYLIFTNHLNDRELYTRLYDRVLRTERPAINPELGYSETIDLLETNEWDPDTGEARECKVERDDHLPRSP